MSTPTGDCSETEGTLLGDASCSPFQESESSRMGRTLFVYASGGSIRCVSVEETQNGVHKQLEANGWKHTATLDPARWIEALLHADPMSATDMMDEVNFGANSKQYSVSGRLVTEY